MRVQLILEGGGMRGVYTCGVLDFFMEHGIVFEDIVAVSAGTATGASYVSWQPYRTKRVFLEYSTDERYMGIKTYLKTGSFFGMDFIFKEIPEQLLPFDFKRYNQGKMRLEAVVTDAQTGEAKYFHVTQLPRDTDYLIASSSIPVVSKPVLIGNREYFDGGVSDSIPIRYSKRQGYDLQVLVLTRPVGYRKKSNKEGKFSKLFLRKYPEIVKALQKRAQVYNDDLIYIDALEHEGNILVIRPSEALPFDRFEKDPQNLVALYDLGYRDAQAQYQALIAYAKGADNFTYDKKLFKRHSEQE